MDEIPCLAWCARLDITTQQWTLFHGASVVVDSNTFVEGGWDGEFSQRDFIDSHVMCGTGGTIIIR